MAWWGEQSFAFCWQKLICLAAGHPLFARGLTKDNAAFPSICGEQPLPAPARQGG